MSQILFEVDDPQLISVNDQYMHPVRKCKDGRYRSYTCSSPDLKSLQSFYKGVLESKVIEDDIKVLKDFVDEKFGNGVLLEIVIGCPLKEIYENDASNYVKAIEDVIVKRTKIDDSRNLKVSIEKRYVEGDQWKLLVRLSPYEVKKYRGEFDEEENS